MCCASHKRIMHTACTATFRYRVAGLSIAIGHWASGFGHRALAFRAARTTHHAVIYTIYTISILYISKALL